MISFERYQEMIGDVIEVLRGKTGALVRSLEKRMNDTSDELRFEILRGSGIKYIGNLYNDRQKVVDRNISIAICVPLAVDGDDACGVVFKVREGKINGLQHFYIPCRRQAGRRNSSSVPRPVLSRCDGYTAGNIFTDGAQGGVVIEQWLTDRGTENISIVLPKIGQKAKLMAMCKNNAQLLLDMLKIQKEKNKDFVPHAVQALQHNLRLDSIPRRIECIDISNFQGTESVASMVVFIDGRARKSEYRKFKIETVHGANDFASMKEVIGRRFARDPGTTGTARSDYR